MMANAKGEGATGLPSKKRRWVPVSSDGGEEGGGGEAERDRGIRVTHSSSSGCGSGSSSSSSSSGSGSGNSFNEEKRRGETAHDGDDDGNGHGRSERGEIVGGHLPPPSPHHNSHLKHNRDWDRDHDHEHDRGRGRLSSSLSSSSCSRSPSSSSLLRGSSPPTTQKKLKFVLKVTPPSGSKPNSNVSEGQEEPKPETSKPDKEVPFSEELAKKILDTLQLKDTYKAFSNPVDSKEVPDYYNVIKNPMDFGTMRKKLSKGLYKSLNDFQEDISLICSNAMHFNAKDTVYYKQARAIQDTASKIIVVLRTQGVAKVEEVLRTFGGGGSSTTTKSKESPVAVPKRKYTKRSHIWKARLERRYGINSSGGQNSVSQRLGSCYDSTGLAHQSSDFHQFPTDDGNVDHYEDTAGKMSFKDNKKFQVNGLKRSSYCRRPNSSSMIEKGILPWTCDGSILQLTPTGYSMDYVYAKSLTRFAADLGPAFWKIAQGKVQRALPRGIPFGPGWVGEQEARLISHLFTNSQQQQKRQQQQPPSLPPSKDNREIKVEQQQPPSLPPSKDSREIKVEQQQQPNNPSQAKTNQVMRCSKIDSSACSSSITSNSRLALESAVSSQQPLQNSTLSNSGGEVTKLTLGAAGFTSEMSQSKLLEIMSQKNRLTTATKTASLPSSSRGKPIVADLNSAACELGKQPSEPVNGRSLWSIAQSGLERDSSQHLRLSEEQERIRFQAYLEAQKQSKSLAFPTSEQQETGQTAGKNGFQQQLSTSSFRRNDSSEASFLQQQQNLHKLQMAKAQQNPWLLPPSSGIQPANLNFLNISGQPSQKPWISSCSLLQTTHGLPQDLNTSLSDSKSSTETSADPPHPDLALQL